MSNLTDKFAALTAQMNENNAAVLSVLADVITQLELQNTQLDTITINNAVNTRAIIAALGANSPCMPCPTPPIYVPPISVVTSPTGEDQCKRAQAFIAYMQASFTVLDTASAFGVPFNPALIIDAVAQVVASFSWGDTPPAISFPEAVQLGGALLNYVAAGFFVEDTLRGYFDPLVTDLQAALFAATTPAEAQTAYNAIVDASGYPTYATNVLKDAAYVELFSYFFDPTTDPDLSGYDGSICGGADECVIVTSPVDTGTTQYDYAGNHYQRVDVTAIDIAPRIIGSTTIQCPVALTISFGALVGSVAADELISFSDMAARIGTSPRYLDSANPSEEMQIEFCGLAPLE